MATVSDLLLARQGRISVAAGSNRIAQDRLLRAADLELVQLGYAMSYKLRNRLATMSSDDLGVTLKRIIRVLAEHIGAADRHVPLFRQFPDGVPDDTFALWVKRYLVHFLQSNDDEPCLFCGNSGCLHVLRPCHHVVCSKCFDGANYSGCPVCNQDVDQTSPFFQPADLRVASPRENVKLKLIDLGDGDGIEAQRWFQALCARTQALSPDDLDGLRAILVEFNANVLGWLPEVIPLKENIAAIFGELLKTGDPDKVLTAGKPYLRTATDVLRLVAAYSGADVSLQGQAPTTYHAGGGLPSKVFRFRVAPMKKALRRSILGLLDQMQFDLLLEDMLRHQSFWVWLGEFLHPFEYAKRFPNTTVAFVVLRGTKLGADYFAETVGQRAGELRLDPAQDGLGFQTFYGKLAEAARAGDAARFLDTLVERPGELARRVLHALQLTLDAGQPTTPVVAAYCAQTPKFATPVLATLAGLLPSRLQTVGEQPERLFWPKGQPTAVAIPETRKPLTPAMVAPMVDATKAELVRRFSGKQRFTTGIVDRGLDSVIVPFAERAASRTAVSLTRGSWLPAPTGGVTRLFLHWCEPADGDTTDLDLSVGFFGDDWKYLDVCSYYQHKSNTRGLATSAGDKTSAPFPNGSTELVDIHLDRARQEDVRYAVMVVNAYRGMPFSKLDRSYAGVMERTDPGGLHFDPRTVKLKFALQGEHGIYIPLVYDMHAARLHWLDIYAKGMKSHNNVETCHGQIAEICPQYMRYFATGARMSMYDLGLLHAAARCDTVYLRGSNGVQRFTRAAHEDALAFYRRLTTGAPNETGTMPKLTDSTFACLLHGDVEMPANSTAYALFRDQLTQTVAGSDLLS
ncbi:MAG: hypothetical protein K2X93_28755 [Candidatus Obscuribacterales bacterium]|nr:hypothetical protein [Candidatus Obscuribacterales bacterium]